MTKITFKDLQIKIGVMSIYVCPKCKGNDLKEHYKFCPHCGEDLYFDF